MISLEINSIRNPVDYISPGDLDISFETPSGGIIAQGKWGEWTTEYSSSKIDQFLVRAEDETVGLLNVTYSFVVVPRGQVAQGAKIRITVPKGIKMGPIALLTSLGFPDKEIKISQDG